MDQSSICIFEFSESERFLPSKFSRHGSAGSLVMAILFSIRRIHMKKLMYVIVSLGLAASLFGASVGSFAKDSCCKHGAKCCKKDNTCCKK